jgi:RNA polymerase primary sigma factor
MPENIVATVNRLVRMSRRLLLETGHEPSAQELAQRLAMPVGQVGKLMDIAGLPVNFEAADAG